MRKLNQKTKTESFEIKIQQIQSRLKTLERPKVKEKMAGQKEKLEQLDKGTAKDTRYEWEKEGRAKE